MYKIILVFILIFLTNVKLVLSQGIINNGASIVITSGTSVILKDANANYTNTASETNGVVDNEGVIYLDGNWIDNSSNNVFLNQTNNGLIIFNGTYTISGSTTNFASIIINGILTGDSSNMNVAGNWTNNGIFNHNNGNVTFDGNTTFSGSTTTTFNNVDVAPGKFLTIDGGGKIMRVANKIHIKATDAHNRGQLAIADNTSKLTGTGGNDSVYVEVYDTLNNWHYQSVPIYNGYMGAMVLRYYYGKRWDETTNTYTQVTGYDSLQVGRGYTLKFNSSLLNESKRLTTFVAPILKLHTGTITLAVTNTAGKGDGWNLVGNPYPSAIDWEASQGWNCKNIEPTIYLYDAVKKRYTTYNSITHTGTNGGNRYIPPMEGVFIHCSSKGQWSMDNRVRVTFNQPYLKGETQDDTQSIHLIVDGNGYSDESIIAFTPNSTSGFDTEQDAYKLLSPEGTVAQINTKTLDTNNLKLSVNFLPMTLKNNVTVPVDFTVGVSGTYTISLNDFSSFDPSINITLEDMKKKSNTIIDMRTSTYTFESDSVSGETRFMLHFSNTQESVREINLNNNINIFTDKKQIVVQNKSHSADKMLITVYDMLGKQVASQQIQSNGEEHIDMNGKEQAIYFVKVSSINYSLTKKVCIIH